MSSLENAIDTKLLDHEELYSGLIELFNAQNLLMEKVSASAAQAYKEDRAKNFKLAILHFCDAANIETTLNLDSSIQEFREAILILKVRKKAANYSPLISDNKNYISPEGKSGIHDHLTKIRQIIESSDIKTNKKDEIYEKIADLGEVIDRDRTAFEDFLDKFYLVADCIEYTGNKAKPLLRQITKLLKEATDFTVNIRGLKQIEAAKTEQLPSPEDAEDAEDTNESVEV